MTPLVVLVVVVGVGTWAFRYVPVALTARRRRSREERGLAAGEVPGGPSTSSGPDAASWLKRFLAAMGVAAVAALAGAALLPYLVGAVSVVATALGAGATPASEGSVTTVAARLIPLLAGIAGTVGAFLPRRSVAAATLAGACSYALVWWVLAA